MNGNIGNIGNMGDMGSVIAKMLEDPEALGKVMSLAGKLSSAGLLGGFGLGDNGESRAEPEVQAFRETPQNTVKDSSKYEIKKAVQNQPQENSGILPEK